MLALQILRHAVFQIFGNFGRALRVSVPVYFLMIIAIGLASRRAWQVHLFADDPQLARELLFADFFLIWATAIVSILVGLCWIAVAWHRYILLNEDNGIVFPKFHGKNILFYLLRIILILIIVLVCVGFPLVIFSSLFGVNQLTTLRIDIYRQDGAIAFILNAIFTIAFTFAILRLSPLLPSIAIGKSMKFKEAWAATDIATVPMFHLAVIQTIVGFIGSVARQNINADFVAVWLALTLIVQWLTMMIGVSVLTTIYGHYIENRALR